MALFGAKKNTGSKAPKAKKEKAAAVKPVGGKDLSHVLKRPRITEKATMASEAGVYVFEVAPEATKRDVVGAVKAQYNVTPIKVNIVRIPRRAFFSKMRGKKGSQGALKKAYVYVAKGETISIV